MKKIQKKMVLILTLVFSLVIIACATELYRKSGIPIVGIQGADYMGWESCDLCHEQKVKDFVYMVHGRLWIAGNQDQPGIPVCEACHGPASLHVEAGGGRGVYILNPGKKPEVCFQCHTSIQARLRLQYHHPVKEAVIFCTDCHNLHGENIYSVKEMPISRGNTVCMQCHREQTRPRVFEHEALRDGCTICHHAHGSINDKMLIERDNNLCLKCHAQLGTPGTVTIGDFPHTTRLMEGTCWSVGCHTAVHGSNINSHLRY